MALTPGTRIGPYEIVSAIGAGGMGEVYRAHDSKLNRHVALKLLLPDVADNPERLARFRREAQVLASLNHPNIAQIHGIEEAEGRTALVMELVDGEDLSQHIAQGAIPLDEGLAIAKQIAAALESAHEQGIIHRDLKPANIKVRADGTVKVLDFGLAKAMDPSAGLSPNVTQSPTLTSPAMTQTGMILGTAAYMAPEQARGRVVDKRADIWAFGCVLFEMLTGERAFRGDDLTETLAAIVRDQPDVSRAPRQVQRLLRKCLEKDPKQRLRDLGDVWELLDEARSSREATAHGVRVASVSRLAWIGWGVAAIAVVAGAFAFNWPQPSTALPASAPGSTWLTATLPADLPLFVPNIHRGIAITPDGSAIVYVTRDGLAVRRLDSREATLLPGTIGGRAPFISTDGARVGFVNDTAQLLTTPIRGGPTEPVNRGFAPNGGSIGVGGFQGGTFLPDGGVIYAAGGVSGLVRIDPDGRTSSSLTSLDPARSERSHQWPVALPHGRSVLFTIVSGPTNRPVFEVAALDVASGKHRVLAQGSQPDYLEGGYCTFIQDGQLFVASLDPERLELTSSPVMLVDHVDTVIGGAAYYGVSRTGTLVFLPGPVDINRSLVWRDRAERETPIPAPRSNYLYPRLSPDETRVAIDTRDNNAGGIALYDLRRDVLTRLPLNGPGAQYPVWHPDSRHLYYGRAGQVWSQSVDGGAAVAEAVGGATPLSVDRSGTRMVIGMTSEVGRWLGLAMPGAQAQVAQLLRADPAWIAGGEISPDGRFLAYQASESSRGYEIYVVPFPDVTTARWQVSSDGGTRPAWSRDGKELFFLNASGAMMRVPVTLGQTFANGTPEKLFDAVTSLAGFPSGRNYDVAADGRFLMVKDGFLDAPHPLALTAALNWIAEVKAKVGTKP